MSTSAAPEGAAPFLQNGLGAARSSTSFSSGNGAVTHHQRIKQIQPTPYGASAASARMFAEVAASAAVPATPSCEPSNR